MKIYLQKKNGEQKMTLGRCSPFSLFFINEILTKTFP